MTAKKKVATPYEQVHEAFERTAETGPVTVEEILVALQVAETEFNEESYSAHPFLVLQRRLIGEGMAKKR